MEEEEFYKGSKETNRVFNRCMTLHNHIYKYIYISVIFFNNFSYTKRRRFIDSLSSRYLLFIVIYYFVLIKTSWKLYKTKKKKRTFNSQIYFNCKAIKLIFVHPISIYKDNQVREERICH